MAGKFPLRRAGALLALLLLIFDSRAAVQGAREGISLCIEVLIPSLFPFLVVSRLLTTGCGYRNNPRCGKILRRVGIPDGCGDLVALGFLSGYPAGAANVSLSWREGALPRREAEMLLPLCSNAGPAFLFGVMGQLLDGPWDCWLLWGILVGASLLTGMLLQKDVPSCSRQRPPSDCDLPQALRQSVKSMALVCGWVVLFRVLLTVLDRRFLAFFSPAAGMLLTGFLEISNGCMGLRAVPSSGVRLILAAGMLSWGGLCILLQIRSVTAGLSLGYYVRCKLVQTFLSILIAFSCVTVSKKLIFVYFLLIAAFAALPRENRGSNSRRIRV